MSSKEVKRVPIRVSRELYEKFNLAAKIFGVPLNSFLILAMNKGCDEVLQKHFNGLFDLPQDAVQCVWKVDNIETANWLVDQCNSPCISNNKLKSAYTEYKTLMEG